MATYLYLVSSPPSTVPDPVYDVTENINDISEGQRAVDGTLIRHTYGLKHSWRVRWAYLTQAQADTMRNLLQPQNRLYLQFPWDSSPHEVMTFSVDFVHTQFGIEINAIFEEV